jgi:hypothetical protein
MIRNSLTILPKETKVRSHPFTGLHLGLKKEPFCFLAELKDDHQQLSIFAPLAIFYDHVARELKPSSS